MEAQYHQFSSGSTESASITLPKGKNRFSPNYTHSDMAFGSGIKNIAVYVLYAVLVLLLFILLLITGVKFSQLSKDVNEIKAQLIHFTRHNSQTSEPGSSQFQAPAEKILDEITPVRGKCREGWVSNENSCYFLSVTEKPWSAAETQCQNLQGHLLVVNNADELDYISKIAGLGSNYWIGLVERHNEGNWSWVDGSDYTSMEKFWDRGQPDDWDYRENGEDCGQIHGTDRHKRRLWNDADCSLSYRYICESKI